MQAPTPAATPAPPATPAEPADPWTAGEGWHRIATVPALQRRPRAVSATRVGPPAIAVLGERGRRVMLLRPGSAPLPILLPQDILAVDLAWDESGENPVLFAVSARDKVAVQVLPEPGEAVEVGRTELAPGRIRVQTRFDGAVEILDALLRPDPNQPAVRGVAGPGGHRYRGTEQGGLPAVVRSGVGDRQVAVLARIPKAESLEVLAMDRAAPDAADEPARGWAAAWTGEGEERALHFVRFDGLGRVLLTADPPSSDAPSAFDLRTAVLGDKDLVLVLPGEDGASVWRHAPAADGTRLEVKLTP